MPSRFLYLSLSLAAVMTHGDLRLTASHESFSSLKIAVTTEKCMTKISPDFPYVSPFHLFTSIHHFTTIFFTTLSFPQSMRTK